MLKGSDGFCLALEKAGRFFCSSTIWMGRTFSANNLDRNLPVYTRILHKIHFTHATTSE